MPQQKNYNNPEQYKTEKKSLFDQHDEEKHVDPLPVEDLRQEVMEEKDKKETKQSSSTEKKYEADFETIKKSSYFPQKRK